MRCRGLSGGFVVGALGVIFMVSIALSGTSGASPSGLTKISSDNDLPVSATDNIYGAGQATPPDPGGNGGGELPVEVGVASGATWISFSKVTGTVSLSAGETNGPDGNPGDTGAMGPYGPISGLVDSASWFYLTGVFIDANDNSANATPPATPNFTGDHSFATLSPTLDQQFFVGDGLTGTGSGATQYFQVPTGATDLYLGFADSSDNTSPPGHYSDNTGSLSANVDLWSGQVSSNGPVSGTLLGGLDVAGYCAAQSEGTTQLSKGAITGTNFAYNNWECTGSGILSMQKVCAWEYPAEASQVVAKASDSNDAFSWQCYVAAARSFTRHGTIAAATSTGNVAPIASSLATPRDAFHSMSHNVENAVITVVVILFITFPAIVFNNTFSSNYAEILLIFAGFRRRVRRTLGLKVKNDARSTSPSPSAGTPLVDTPGRASRVAFLGVLIVGAILGGLLSPKFGFNARSLADIGSTMVAFAFGALVGWFVSTTFRHRHHYPTHTYLKALPLGLGVAAVCVLVSRLTSFEPGYLYGIVVSIGFIETLEERHNAHLTAISTLSTLGIALVAWFLWLPANHFALEHATNIPLAILDDVLASIFVGGLVGTVIGLLPLEFMPGGTIAKWRKDVWAIIFFVAVFLLLEVELRPAAGPTHPGGAPIATAVILFILFGGGSFWMRHYFAQRQAAKTAVAVPADAGRTSPPDGSRGTGSGNSADHDG